MPFKILTFGIAVWSRHNMLLHVCIGFDLSFEAHILTAITVTKLRCFRMGPLQYNLDNLQLLACLCPRPHIMLLSVYRYFPLGTCKLLTWSNHAPERCNSWLSQYDWSIVERGITPLHSPFLFLAWWLWIQVRISSLGVSKPIIKMCEPFDWPLSNFIRMLASINRWQVLSFRWQGRYSAGNSSL